MTELRGDTTHSAHGKAGHDAGQNKAAAAASENDPFAAMSATYANLTQGYDKTHPAVERHAVKPTSASDSNSDSASDSTEAPAPTPDEKRLAYLQATVKNFLPEIDSNKADAALRQKAVEAEAGRHEFGPATRDAYKDYVGWLEKTAIPSTQRDLKRVGLSENEGDAKAPPAPPLKDGSLQIDTAKIPDENTLKRLDDAVKWAQRSSERVDAANAAILKKVDISYADAVTRLGLPRGWLQDLDRDQAQWRKSVGGLIDGALTAKSNLEILSELNQSGAKHDLPAIVGPGRSVTTKSDGTLASVHLNLPQSWDTTSGDNKQRAESLANLVNETNSLVAHSLPQLRAVNNHPERTLSWGDTEVKDTQGRFDSAGNFLGMVKKGDAVKEGEHAEDINLVESRFSVENKDGRVVLHQRVQAQSVPWWGYQNLIGVKDVGKPIEMTQSYAPDESVIVRTGQGYEVKAARDLAGYRNWQMGKHYGEKALMGALDAGMVVSGTVELGAAYRAARMTGLGMTALDVLGRAGAKTIAVEGVDASGRMIAGQAAKGLLRTTVGVTGVFNNAGARESTLGENVNLARSLYFLSDAAIGLTGTSVRAGRALLGRSAAAEGEGSLAALARAGRPPLIGLRQESMAEAFYRANRRVSTAAELGFVPLVGSQFYNSIERLHDSKSQHIIRAARIVADQERPE